MNFHCQLFLKTGGRMNQQSMCGRIITQVIADRGSRIADRSSRNPQSSSDDDERVPSADHVRKVLVISHVDAPELFDDMADFGG
jgi:hypothetical protein